MKQAEPGWNMGMYADLEIGLAATRASSCFVYRKSSSIKISKQTHFGALEHFWCPTDVPHFLITGFQLDARVRSKNGAHWGTKTPIVNSLTQLERKKRGGGGGGEGEYIYIGGGISILVAAWCPNVPQIDENVASDWIPTICRGAHAEIHVPQTTYMCPRDILSPYSEAA